MPTPVFYNSLTKATEQFAPIEPGKATLYHCGPTVYKRQHLGNMRRVLFADFLRRSLEFLGYEVHEIMNITDVGHLTQDTIDAGIDKVTQAAQARQTTPADIAAKETEQFFTDIAALNIQPAHNYPRATAHIKEMQALITLLLEKKHAYQTASGIYFEVASFPNYGKLSGNTLASLESGKRIAVRQEKKHPTDFALWVFDAVALQKWDSPWGVGYPGWHIECSAMSAAYLSLPIDIHTGGEDNKFPHHENEIAQSESASGQKFVQIWMHNAHLNLQGGKLSKSSGQQLTLDDLVSHDISPLTFRLFAFGSHYRTPMEFSWEAVGAANENVQRLYQVLRQLHEIISANPAKTPAVPDATVIAAFGAALGDDLNTPAALAVVNTYITTINQRLAQQSPAEALPHQALATFLALDHVLGICAPFLASLKQESIPEAVTQLAVARQQARATQDFAAADTLRHQIEAAGFTIEDTPEGFRLLPQ